MVKLPTGKTKHVDESKGPDNNIMKFYITEYSSNHALNGFLPRMGTKTGTGYKSNFRPGVYYSRKLDELDNPAMGRIVNDNYESITQKSFKGWKGSDGKDPFVTDPAIAHSGFVRNDKMTIPTYNDVYPKSAPASLSRRPIDISQNFTSEHHSQFVKKNPLVNTNGKTLGRKEGTGFTHEKNLEPITFHPEECHDGSVPPMYTNRPTGVSEMRSSFLPSFHPHGSERFQIVNEKAERNNGFTRFIKPTADLTGNQYKAFSQIGDLHPLTQQKIKKQDPSEYLNLLHPQPYVSTKQATFQGRQRNEPTLDERIGNITIGEKEHTGYSSNNKGYLLQPIETNQFATNYQHQFFDKNGILVKKHENLYKSGVFPPNSDGYTKNEKVHVSSKAIDREHELKTLHPYVNRSLKARDPFYAEQIHQHKQAIKTF